MKDIDFIPSWYHTNRHKCRWFRQRYITVGVILVCWTLSNIISDRIISQAHGQLDSLEKAYEQGMQKIARAQEYQMQIDVLEGRGEIINQLSLRTPISQILAEFSQRIGHRALLNRITLHHRSITESSSSAWESSAAVQLTASKSKSASAADSGPQCLELIIDGYAANSIEFASLIARLEDSQYFRQVCPVFSRNATLEEKQVTEFEIRCVIADFQEIK